MINRIKSKGRTLILLSEAKEAFFLSHEEKINCKIKLPKKAERKMLSKGTIFTKKCKTCLDVYSEHNIIEWLSKNHIALKEDVLILHSMQKEGPKLWNDANMLELSKLSHIFIMLSQYERIKIESKVRKETNDNGEEIRTAILTPYCNWTKVTWESSQTTLARFIKALNGDEKASRDLINLYRNRFRQRPLDLNDQRKLELMKARHEISFKNRRSIKTSLYGSSKFLAFGKSE